MASKTEYYVEEEWNQTPVEMNLMTYIMYVMLFIYFPV